MVRRGNTIWESREEWIDGQEAVECRVREREILEGYTNWFYMKKVEYIVKEILTCVSILLYGNEQCGMQGSCWKTSLQWYSSKLQVMLWARNASKNSLGSSCILSNQNLFCWLKHSGNGKTLLRRFSTSAPLFYSHVSTNANGGYKKPVHLGNYSELEKTYRTPMNKFQFQVVQLQFAAVVF